jgi:hypothetical protein
VVCVFVGIWWITSAWWAVAYRTPTNLVNVSDGCIIFRIGSPARSSLHNGWNVHYRGGWYYGFNTPLLRNYGQGDYWARIPFWLILFAVGIPTAWLWLRDRPMPSGHCRCGYGLTGSVSGVCPECGEKV